MFSPSSADGVFRQGEIVSDVIQVHLRVESLDAGAGDVELEEKLHPFALVLTQDCDLDWDFKARGSPQQQSEPDEKAKNRRQAKLVPNILLCELITTEVLRPLLAGGDILRRIRGNLDERYHCLPQIDPEIDLAGKGLPELVADFKRIFSIPTDELYLRLTSGLKRRAILQSPYLQHLSSRFGYYCLRVAIPEEILVPAPRPGPVMALPPPAPAGQS